MQVLLVQGRSLPRRLSLCFGTIFSNSLSEYLPKLDNDSSMCMPREFKSQFKNPAAQGSEIPIDFYETDREIFIDADLPGVEKKNVDLSIDSNGTLHIHAKKKTLNKDDVNLKVGILDNTSNNSANVMERVKSEMKFYVLERSSANLDRSVSLPINADRWCMYSCQHVYNCNVF